MAVPCCSKVVAFESGSFVAHVIGPRANSSRLSWGVFRHNLSESQVPDAWLWRKLRDDSPVVGAFLVDSLPNCAEK